MKLYTCTVKIGGSLNHVVTGRVVSVPEIAVLRAIHGPEFVTDFKNHEPRKDSQEIEWTPEGERARLTLKYPPLEDDGKPIVDDLFGPMGRLPATLADLGITAASMAAEKRALAAKLAAEAEALESDGDTDQAIDAFLAEDDPPATKTRAKAA